jgi:hypothetical protein
MDDDEAVLRVVRGISRYLAEHPEAADTVDGIQHWWLPRLGIDATVNTLHAALDRLVADGIVERRALPDGGTVYGRGHRRYVEAQSDRRPVGEGRHG